MLLDFHLRFSVSKVPCLENQRPRYSTNFKNFCFWNWSSYTPLPCKLSPNQLNSQLTTNFLSHYKFIYNHNPLLFNPYSLSFFSPNTYSLLNTCGILNVLVSIMQYVHSPVSLLRIHHLLSWPTQFHTCGRDKD